MLPDVKARRTGKFDDWRGYRNGKHNGEDWAAPEGISRAVEEANSDLEAARIAVVASEDPVAALAMTEGSPYLLPDTAAGLRKKLSGEVERLERQAAAEAEKAAIYAATDALMERFGTDERAAWNAMENDPSLDPETRERIWGKYKARLSDRKRWEAQRDRDYMSGWMDKIADSSSLEEAQQLIQDSGADGRQRVQLERWAVQIHRPEKFKEDIRDWAQAFKEVMNGQLKTDEELIYRWGGRLKDSTLKGLVRMFYKERASGTGKKGADYVGYSFSKAITTAMEKLRIKEGSQESALFTTMVGEEILDRETQLKRKLTPLEKSKVLEETSTSPVRGLSAKTPTAATSATIPRSPTICRPWARAKNPPDSRNRSSRSPSAGDRGCRPLRRPDKSGPR